MGDHKLELALSACLPSLSAAAAQEVQGKKSLQSVGKSSLLHILLGAEGKNFMRTIQNLLEMWLSATALITVLEILFFGF